MTALNLLILCLYCFFSGWLGGYYLAAGEYGLSAFYFVVTGLVAYFVFKGATDNDKK